jgi:uridine phosphorylase
MALPSVEQMVAAVRSARPGTEARVPPSVMVIYDSELFATTCDALGAEHREQWVYSHRPLRRLFAPSGEERFALLHTEIGAPLLVYLLEFMIACGLRSVVLVTSGCALAPELTIGDLFLVTGAYSDNGVTNAYFPEVKTFQSSTGTTSRLSDACVRAGVEAINVQALSSDAFFQCSSNSPLESQAQIMEMEAASAFAIAAARGIEAGAIGYVADRLVEGRWVRPAAPYYPERRLDLVKVIGRYVDALPHSGTRS